MKGGGAVEAIISLGLLAILAKLLKDALFPPDPEYIARKHELALAHTARVHLIEEVALGILLGVIVIAVIVGAYFVIARLRRESRIVKIKPDEGGQFPLLRLESPDSSRVVVVNPNNLLGGILEIKDGTVTEKLPTDHRLLRLQHSTTARAQAVQAIRAGAGRTVPMPPVDEVIDGDYEDVPIVTGDEVSTEKLLEMARK